MITIPNPQLEQWVKDQLANGYKSKQIKLYLINKGYKESDITPLFKKKGNMLVIILAVAVLILLVAGYFTGWLKFF